jgi:hypothetical protein
LSLIIKKIMGLYVLLLDNNVEIMINNPLLIASTALVFAISLVMIGSLSIQPAEASGPGCPNKRAAGSIVDPNAVNTQIPATSQPQLAGQTV